MKITYHKEANAVYIKFTNLPVSDTQEDESGNIIIDYASDKSIVGIEILNASSKILIPDTVDYEIM